MDAKGRESLAAKERREHTGNFQSDFEGAENGRFARRTTQIDADLRRRRFGGFVKMMGKYLHLEGTGHLVE
jgi:hypothetical protein